MKIQKLVSKLKENKVVIMDGATGTEIQRRGVKTTLPLWSADALLKKSDVVRQIHSDYIQAGAEIIITNTFRTTRRTLEKTGMGDKAKELTLLACKLAREAVAQSGKAVYVAGSVAPLEDCYSPELTPNEAELQKEHDQYAADLAEGKVDFILIETMITLRETAAALKAAKKTGLRLAVSFCINKEGKLLSGESLEDAVTLSVTYNPLFISINCVNPDIIDPYLKKLHKITQIPLGAYGHGNGKPDDDQGWLFDASDTGKDYLKFAQQWVKDGAQVIGGCCGTTAKYIATLSKHLQK